MLWLSLGKLGLRSAARDIAIERENYRFCFPIVTLAGRQHCRAADLLNARSRLREIAAIRRRFGYPCVSDNRTELTSMAIP